MYATSYNFGSDPSNTKRKRVDSGPKNTAKKQIPAKRQKKTHDSEDNGIAEEDGSDGDDESNGDSDNDNDHDNDDHDNDNDNDEVVEEVDLVAEYEAMRESIQKERRVSSIFSLINLLIFVRLLANIPIEDKTNVLKTYRLYILLEQWWLMVRNVTVIGARFAGKFFHFHLP